MSDAPRSAGAGDMGRLSPIVHVWFSCEMVSVAGALQGQQNKQDPPQSTAMCSRPFLGIAVGVVDVYR